MARRITAIPDEEPEQFRGWAEALGGFLAYKQAQGVSRQTYEDYDKAVRLFFKRFPDAWTSPGELKTSLFVHLSADIKPATFNNRLTYLRAFLNWCVENGCVKENPIAKIKKRLDLGRVVNIDPEVLRELLALPNQRTFTGLRDYAFILLTLDSGIRPKEAMSLIPCDFNEKAEEIYIPSTVAKTRVSRTLPISIQTVKAIKRVIAVRPKEWDEKTPIFCTWDGGSLTRHTWGDRMEFYSDKLGVKIRPYDLRHSFSLEYLRGGSSVFHLQKMLGHTDLKMTQRYLSLLDEDLRAGHEKSSPLKRLLPEGKPRITRT